MEGKIEKWIDDKNFGFIDIGEAKGLFFHRNELAEGYTPKEGDRVEFEKTQTEKGPAAAKVKKIQETTVEATTEVAETVEKPEEEQTAKTPETKEETEQPTETPETTEEQKE